MSFQRPRTAGAWDLENWCLGVDDTVKLKKPPQRDLQRGDIVIYTFSHTGFAVSPVDAEGYFDAVEGNTNIAGSREGDGVYKKKRHISKVRSRIRFV